MSNPQVTSFLTDLSFTPATLFGFGFQTHENITNSSVIYDNVTIGLLKYTCKYLNEVNSFMLDRNKAKSNSIKSAIITANVVNVLGYIPFVGRLIGAVRILAALSTPLNGKQKAAHIIRGLSEVTGYNKIRLVIDIAATVFNFAKKSIYQHHSI